MKGKTTCEHGAKRRNNPTAEMATTSHPERRAPARHKTDVKEKDRSRIPTPDWSRQPETKTVLAPLLSTVEKIDPAAWIGTLRRQPEQGDMFGSFDRCENPARAKWEWYEHRGNWQSRLIHAAAKRAMASLLEHEQMAGEVRCICCDPPSAMDLDARDMDDTVQVTAFRDSYQGGIHTYLDGIREIALLGRELLSETGSFFMQIGDVNVRRCAMVLDEVFGPENRITTITYATGGGGASSRSISKAGDFILWYAWEAAAPMRFQTRCEEQDLEAWCDSPPTFMGVDLPDGSSRTLTTAAERRDPRRRLPDPRLRPALKRSQMLAVAQQVAPCAIPEPRLDPLLYRSRLAPLALHQMRRPQHRTHPQRVHREQHRERRWVPGRDPPGRRRDLWADAPPHERRAGQTHVSPPLAEHRLMPPLPARPVPS